MKLKLLQSTLLIMILAVLVGCNTRRPPSPEMTRSGGPGPGIGADYIDSTDVYGAGAAGLELRDPSLTSEDARARQLRGVLAPVYFDFDRSDIRPSERSKLQEAYSYLINNPDHTLLIEGHCDWRGTPEYNLALGDRRAASAKNFLIELGIDAARIETLSKGDLEAVSEASESEMQDDRRAELIPVRAAGS